MSAYLLREKNSETESKVAHRRTYNVSTMTLGAIRFPNKHSVV